jgi:DnaJ-class molecular chaperone
MPDERTRTEGYLRRPRGQPKERAVSRATVAWEQRHRQVCLACKGSGRKGRRQNKVCRACFGRGWVLQPIPESFPAAPGP